MCSFKPAGSLSWHCYSMFLNNGRTFPRPWFSICRGASRPTLASLGECGLTLSHPAPPGHPPSAAYHLDVPLGFLAGVTAARQSLALSAGSIISSSRHYSGSQHRSHLVLSSLLQMGEVLPQKSFGVWGPPSTVVDRCLRRY